MVSIFYRKDDRILISTTVDDFAKLRLADVLWIDLLSPSGDEKRATEAFLGTVIQSRAQAEEIESSSRFSESGSSIYANTNFLMPGPEEYTMEAVSFTITGNTLTSLRDVPLRSFTELQRRMEINPKLYKGGYSIFATILEQRIDLDADMIELMSKDISQFSKRINQQEDINEEFLLDINHQQENAMIIRENIVDKQRLVTSILRSDKHPVELDGRFNVLLQDISSLINHANFSFERLEYLQETVVGLINLEQNKIMKVFTVISVLLMPPTLITSFYGMNVTLPLAGLRWAWLLIIMVMVLVFAAILVIFSKRRLL
jgi:magnesium transporter